MILQKLKNEIIEMNLGIKPVQMTEADAQLEQLEQLCQQEGRSCLDILIQEVVDFKNSQVSHSL
jgi:hypothetical protein